MPYHIKTPAKLNTGDVYWKGGNVWTNVYADRKQYSSKSTADAQAATTETRVIGALLHTLIHHHGCWLR